MISTANNQNLRPFNTLPPEERREMGRQARERFQTSFTGQVFAKNIENVYQGVLKGDPHGRK